MKYLLKILLLLMILVLFVPQTSLAAWWNPFTWKVFNRAKAPNIEVQKTTPTSEIEKLRQEIDDLKRQVGSQKTSTAQQPIRKQTTITELKTQNPEQYKNLVIENKTQLLEATKILSNKKIIARIKPSVVYIETESGSGSGIIVSSDGYIFTNAHVVTGDISATVKLADGRALTGQVVGRDENFDLALLKIGTTGLTAAFLGDSDSAEQGDPVFTFGYPLGIEGDVAFKDGTLSRRQKIDNMTYLEISAQILPGNSGGPLVNQSGEVIGVNTLTLGARKLGGVLIGETLKYALPINIAKSLLQELKEGRSVIVPKITLPNPSPPPPPQTYTLPPPTFVLPPPPPVVIYTSPPPPPPPKQPKAINVGSVEIASTFATLRWDVDPGYIFTQSAVKTFSKFRIGCGQDYSYSIWPIGSSQGSFLGFGYGANNYQGSISNLSPSTTYHCRIEIYNNASGEFVSGSDDYTLTTSAVAP